MPSIKQDKNKSTRKRNCIHAIILALALCLFIGCSLSSDPSEDPYESFVEPQQHDIASSHLSVLSAGKWEDYKALLKPKFDLTAQKALQEILPISTRTSLAKLQSLSAGFKLGAGLGSESGTGATTTATDAAGKKTTTGTETDSTSYGPIELDKVPGGAAGLLSEIQRLLKEASDSGIKSDPLLRYLTATALHQEVQMLQRYLEDTPKLDGYKAFIVRLQLSLMPTTRNQPYDAYSDISFFIKTPLPSNPNLKLCDHFFPQLTPCQKADLPPLQDKQPKVIPLVITDNLEAAFAQRSEDQQLRLALGLMATYGRVGGSMDFEALDRTLREFAGKEYNSLFTVGRLSQNTLRVRMGASRVGQNKYAMMTRTHQITVLLLVPKEAFTEQTKKGLPSIGSIGAKLHVSPAAGQGGEADKKEDDKKKKAKIAEITVASKTFFLDALTGDIPEDRSEQAALRVGRRIVREWARDNHIGWPDRDDIASSQFVRDLLHSVENNDYASFLRTICAALAKHNRSKAGQKTRHFNTSEQVPGDHQEPMVYDYITTNPRYVDSLWVDLLAIRASSRYASDSFRLEDKDPEGPTIANQQQVIVYDDPASNQAWVVLDHAANIDASKATAYISPVIKENGKTDENSSDDGDGKQSSAATGEDNPCSKVICWSSTGCTFSKGTGQVTFLFRSLAKFKLKTGDSATLTVCMQGPSECKKVDLNEEEKKLYKKPSKPTFIKMPVAGSVAAAYALPFTVASNSSRLMVGADNSAVVALTISPQDGTKDMSLLVENALFLDGTELKASLDLKLDKKTIKIIKLSHIVSGSVVRIYRAVNKKRFGDPLVLLPLAPSAKAK